MNLQFNTLPLYNPHRIHILDNKILLHAFLQLLTSRVFLNIEKSGLKNILFCVIQLNNRSLCVKESPCSSSHCPSLHPFLLVRAVKNVQLTVSKARGLYAPLPDLSTFNIPSHYPTAHKAVGFIFYKVLWPDTTLPIFSQIRTFAPAIDSKLVR